MSKSTSSRIVWASAAYDFVITLAFATPWTALWAAELLGRIHAGLQLSGRAPSLDEPLALLFANLLGSLVCVWSIVRMQSPTLRHGAFDTCTRLLFAAWMTYALRHGASQVVVFFVVAELVWAMIQGAVVFRLRRGSGVPLPGELSRQG